MKKFILPITLLLVLCVTLCACTPNDATNVDIDNLDMTEWMANIPDSTLLKNIKIPGSHDAGSIGMVNMACTQSDDIKTQLNKGVRYFDLRVNKINVFDSSSNDYVDKYVIFHDIINGTEFEPIINDIAEFIKDQPTECLILDFQHFKNDSEIGVLDIIEQYNLDEYAILNNTDKSDLDFIDSLKLSDCRGKIVILWGNRGNLYGKNYLFRRDGDHGDTNYDNVSKSYYYSDMQSVKSSEFITNTIPAYYDKWKAFNKGLFILQCQLTANTITTDLKKLEANHSVNMNPYIKNLYNSELLQYTNIIMRDFVTTGDKIKDIVSLNL